MKPTDIGPGCPTITQPFGCTTYQFEWYWPSCPTLRYHDGLDVAGGNCLGTPMLCVGDGIVQAIGPTWPGSDGLGPGSILVKMTDGVYAGYGHGYSAVTVGQSVSKGQIIGTVGSQGNSSGPHVHLLLGRAYGSVPLGSIDPLNYTGPGGGQEDDLTPEQAAQLQALFNWVNGTGNAGYYNTLLLQPETPGGVGAWTAGTGNGTYYNTVDILKRLDAIEAKLGISTQTPKGTTGGGSD